MLHPTFEEFTRLAKQGNVVPVHRELLADTETPVSVFRKLTAESPYAFLLESVEGGEKLARYSFIGTDPAVLFRVEGERQQITSDDASLAPKATPIETLRYLLARYTPVANGNLPPFSGGAVGFMSYDTVRYYERIPDKPKEGLGLPDCLIMIAESLIAFDHVKHRMILISNARIEPGADLRRIYDAAVSRLEALKQRLRRAAQLYPSAEENSIQEVLPLETPAPPIGLGGHSVNGAFRNLSLHVECNRPKSAFIDSVHRAKEYITAGDIFQVVLSQRFSARITCDPFDVYRALRAVNPSPYMFYLKCGDEFQLAGSSPELLARLKGGQVTVRPIAGTRPRGANAEQDLAHEKDLLADKKEIAEHVMLVDLGRNDVGRVSKFGTVTVDDFMTIERYSHVMHIVSNVVGEIAPDRDAVDVLAATFPAGTLTGAPKIRAMEIIDELEDSRRGPYGGTVVYLGFNGAMDSCITIRTAVIENGRVHVQAGAGIVADSNPESEYTECVNKAMGMMKAIELAEKGLE